MRFKQLEGQPILYGEPNLLLFGTSLPFICLLPGSTARRADLLGALNLFYLLTSRLLFVLGIEIISSSISLCDEDVKFPPSYFAEWYSVVYKVKFPQQETIRSII